MTETRLVMPPAQEPVTTGNLLTRSWFDFVSRVTRRVNGMDPIRVPRKTVAELEALDAADWSGCLVICTDDVGGETVAFSDGAAWRRTSDLDEVTT